MKGSPVRVRASASLNHPIRGDLDGPGMIGWCPIGVPARHGIPDCVIDCVLCNNTRALGPARRRQLSQGFWCRGSFLSFRGDLKVTGRTRSLRLRLPLFVAAVALALVVAALFAVVTIQPAAAYRSDSSRVTPAAPQASCTAAQQADRQAALRAYQKRMIAQRRAYFRTHASPKLRHAFVKK